MSKIEEILRALGITRKYEGYLSTRRAVQLALEDEDRLDAITKRIYLTIAQETQCKWTAVERNLRTASHRAWKINPDLLVSMAGYPLSGPPTVSDFIVMLVSSIQRSA